MWNTDTGALKATFAQNGLCSLAFSPDGQLLAAGGYEYETKSRPGLRTETAGNLKVWDLASGKERHVLAGHAKKVIALAFSPDGKTLASGSMDGSARLWDAATGQELAVLSHPHQGQYPKWVLGVTFTPDGTTLVTVTNHPGVIRLWDVATRQVRAELTLEKTDDFARDFTCVALSRTGDVVAAGTSSDSTYVGKPGQVKLWATATGKVLATCKGHTGGVYALEFCADGKTLASAGWDGKVRLWDTVTGQERLALQGHDGKVTCLAFSPTGDALVSGGEDGAARLWLTAAEADLRAFQK